MTFKEKMNEIYASIDKLITKDTPTDQITELGQLKDKVKELGDSHQQTLDDYGQLKDRYIESVKNYGTKEAPANLDEEKEKSFEEIGAEIISKRGK